MVSMRLFFKRAFIALILFQLTGCASNKVNREWIFQSNPTSKNLCSGARLLLNAEKEYDYLEVEIVRSRSGIRFYINILFMQAFPCTEDPNRTTIEICFEEEEEPWMIYPLILRGGQRLLLPQEVSDYLIENLEQGRGFVIKAGHYQLQVIPETFAERYQEMMQITIDPRFDNRLVE